MKISELKNLLIGHPDSNLRFSLPTGGEIPADFHVTEVGHVVKRFIDCGGTLHSKEACVLQVWLANNDKDHRLTAGKLASILELAKPLIASQDLDVEIEYEDTVISQYPVASFEAKRGELTFTLEEKHTDCLAREACGLESGCCGEPECS
jgi:hypothetical protein